MLNFKIKLTGRQINPHELCYQCSKDGPNFLFGKFRIRHSRYEPHFTAERKLLSSQIHTNALFKNSYGTKKGTLIEIYTRLYKFLSIITKEIIFFVTVQQKKRMYIGICRSFMATIS